MVSLGGTPVNDIEIVPTHNRLEIALVDDEEWNLGIELSKVADLAVLLRDEALGEHGELDEKAMLGQIEVGSKSAHRDAAFIPGEWKFERFVNPLVTVEREELRENPLTGVGK
jgi:hypothetical protein